MYNNYKTEPRYAYTNKINYEEELITDFESYKSTILHLVVAIYNLYTNFN